MSALFRIDVDYFLTKIKNLELRIKLLIPLRFVPTKGKLCLFFILIALFYAPLVHAQSSTPSALPPTTYHLPSTILPTSSIYTDLLVHNLFHTFSCLSIGSSVIGQPCLTYQITQNAQGAIQSIPILSSANLSGGLLGTTTGLIAGLYMNPPVRTIDYLASLGEGLGVKEAKAQGVVGSGQAVLNPILTLWQVSRNISYVIMIIIFVIIGLMVMFRTRINPQTVITAQAAIPGLVIGLILITFSYFLAALISDVAFIGTNMVGYYFGAARGDTSQNLLQDLTNQNVLSIFSRFTGLVSKDNLSDALSAVWGSFSGDVQGFLTALAVFVTTQVVSQPTEAFKAIPTVGAGIQAVIVGVAGLFTAANPTAAVGLLLFVVATAILLYAMFRLLLRLINNFLSIIFLTITAPFQFLAAALPGRQEIATAWILNMLSNVLAFPAVLAVFYFVAFILGPSYPGVPLQNTPFRVSDSSVTTPDHLIPVVSAQAPLEIISTNTFPLFGGMNLDFIRLLLAFGALIATPAIPDILSRTIGRVGVAGQLIGQEIGGGVSAGRGYAGQFQSGAGAAGQYAAGARGMFDTPAYKPVIDTTTGKVTGFAPSDIQYSPGGGSKLRSWWRGICLPPNILIATPFGHQAVKDICIGDIVWTIGLDNRIKQAFVKRTIRRMVLKDHKILRLVLADGRQLLVSPGHPDAFGKDLVLLKKGDYLDRSYIVKRELLPYDHKYTYDILPEGETGAYFANNILIGSTLKVKAEIFRFYSQGLLG